MKSISLVGVEKPQSSVVKQLQSTPPGFSKEYFWSIRNSALGFSFFINWITFAPHFDFGKSKKKKKKNLKLVKFSKIFVLSVFHRNLSSFKMFQIEIIGTLSDLSDLINFHLFTCFRIKFSFYFCLPNG